MFGITGATTEYGIIKTEEDIKKFVGNFDRSLCGANGKEYEDEKVLKAGFTCAIDYFIAEAKKNNSFLDLLIEDVMEEVLKTDESYLNYRVADLGDGRFVVMLTIAKLEH